MVGEPGCQSKDWKAMGWGCMSPSSSYSQSLQNPAAPLCTPSPDTQGFCPEVWMLLQGSERCLAHQLHADVDGSGTDGASHPGGPWGPHLLPGHHTQRPDRSPSSQTPGLQSERLGCGSPTAPQAQCRAGNTARLSLQTVLRVRPQGSKTRTKFCFSNFKMQRRTWPREKSAQLHFTIRLVTSEPAGSLLTVCLYRELRPL